MAARTTTRIPMPIKMRAKQFAMFDALKGLTEAIAEKEHQYDQKRYLSDERIEELCNILLSAQIGDKVKIIYYCSYSKRYKVIQGSITKIDNFWKELIVDGMVIDFCDIFDIIID